MTYAEIGAAAAGRFGWKLFTAMRCLPTGEVERVYTSAPGSYPLGGRKPKRDNAWARQVLERGEPYFANDEAGIRGAFADAETLIALGCGAVINVPVKSAGRVVGTLNFLREAGGYRPEHVAAALSLGRMAQPLLR